MNLTTRFGLVGIGALALLSLVHWARTLTSDLPASVSFLLGFLPNVAAAIAIPFVFTGIVADQKKAAAPLREIRRWFYTSLVLSGIGLCGWELIQRKSTNLVFDYADIGATLAGSLLALVVFRLITPTRAMK